MKVNRQAIVKCILMSASVLLFPQADQHWVGLLLYNQTRPKTAPTPQLDQGWARLWPRSQIGSRPQCPSPPACNWIWAGAHLPHTPDQASTAPTSSDLPAGSSPWGKKLGHHCSKQQMAYFTKSLFTLVSNIFVSDLMLLDFRITKKYCTQ